MKIKFLIDYRGVLSKERYFSAGMVWEDCPVAFGEQLIERGIAVEMKVKVAPKQPRKKKTVK